MSFSLIPRLQLPDIPLENGYFPLWPAEKIDEMDRLAFRLWCHQHARYGIPTLELIEWLKNEFGYKRMIEIGAGAGDFCHHLGIPGTDNKCQSWQDVQTLYALMEQPVITYPESVEVFDAVDAIAHYQPDIVFGSWLTQWIDPNKPPPPGGGNVYGIREDKVIQSGVTYVLLGNLKIHGQKKIMEIPHEELTFPFLRSRASSPELDRIFIWEGKSNG